MKFELTTEEARELMKEVVPAAIELVKEYVRLGYTTEQIMESMYQPNVDPASMLDKITAQVVQTAFRVYIDDLRTRITYNDTLKMIDG